MTSARELVDRTVEDFLMTGQRELRAKLGADLTASQTNVTLSSVQGSVASGSLLQAGFELMPVWSLSSSGSIAEVERGDYGSAAVVHTAGEVVEIDPIFTRMRVLRALQSSVNSLSDEPGIWKPATVTFTPTSSQEVYDLGTVEVRRIVRVSQLVEGDWIPIDHSWELVHGLTGQTDITGDSGIRLNYYDSNKPVRVVIETPLGSILDSTPDLEETTGLANVSILAVGAALELNAGRAIKRSFIEGQGDSRRANEVAPFQTESSGRELKALYKRLKGEAVSRLTQLYPYRRKRR